MRSACKKPIAFSLLCASGLLRLTGGLLAMRSELSPLSVIPSADSCATGCMSKSLRSCGETRIPRCYRLATEVTLVQGRLLSMWPTMKTTTLLWICWYYDFCQSWHCHHRWLSSFDDPVIFPHYGLSWILLCMLLSIRFLCGCHGGQEAGNRQPADRWRGTRRR